MPVSSNTLFHFTNSIDNLLGILTNNFIPHYSLEKFYLGNDEIKVAFPMVCFCDIPLTQIKKHFDIYGEYGIGLSKSWGTRNRINPVLYLDKNSMLSNNIKGIFDYISEADVKSNLEKNMMNIVMHIKLYKGSFFRNKKLYKNYKFYNEREWRYIPTNCDYLSQMEFNDSEIRKDYNSKIRSSLLTYHPNDIKYIIIKEVKELKPFIRELKLIKTKFGGEQVDKAISRIITSKQILSDF